ncbi:RidA family protein [Kineococcus sp. SYSU DK003]|uniref:RidA family protein n=1 Tax=Kineococcus sp. SYSU DK003 TaxID=3383124 RepID=UPI003D7E4F25
METQHIGATPGANLSQAVVAGDLVFTAGQVGVVDGELPDDIADEIAAAFDNLEAVLVQAGSSTADIVSATCYVVDLADVPAMNAEYVRRIPEPRPARATVRADLIAPYRFEIQCTAVRRGGTA